MSKRSVDKPSKKELNAHIKSGESINDMAEMYGVSAQTIRNWADSYGLLDKLRKRSRIYCACHGKIKQTLGQLLRQGMNITDMAKELHVSQKSVLEAIKEYGLSDKYDKVKFKHCSNRRKGEREKKTEWWKQTLTDMFNAGMDVNDICEKLNVTKRTVYLRMRQAGLGDMIREHNMPTREEAQQRKERIREMVEDGKNISDIAYAENMHYANAGRVVQQIKQEAAANTDQPDSKKDVDNDG